VPIARAAFSHISVTLANPQGSHEIGPGGRAWSHGNLFREGKNQACLIVPGVHMHSQMYLMCVHNGMFNKAATRVFTYSRISALRILRHAMSPAGTTQHHITVVVPAPFSPRAGCRCINLLPTTRWRTGNTCTAHCLANLHVSMVCMTTTDKEDTAVAIFARLNESLPVAARQTKKLRDEGGGTRLARLQDMFRQVACMQPYWAMVSGKNM
jgi:hypothetical protein